MARDADPIRKIPLPFAGDSWAQPGAQAPPPADERRLRAMGPVRWRVIGYSGVGPGDTPVDGDASTYDMCLVKVRLDGAGVESLARTATLVETGGELAPTGKQITETDASAGEVFLFGVVSTTKDTAAALWIFDDSGAQVLG
jgi:hypothetical protein